MNKEDYYFAAYVAVFGVLWGTIEILLGNILHLFEIPFKGTILSSIGCIICLLGNSFINSKKKSSIIYIGLIAILIRLFSFGIFKIHIFISMFMEALLIQTIIILLGENIIGFIVSGILAVFTPYISSAIFFGIILNNGLEFLQHGIIKDSVYLNQIFHGFIIALILIIIINFLIGILTGIIAYYFRKRLLHESVKS